ncbi:MAG: amino acid permease [Bacteroidetes bacterium]|nr:amino acid permease [Bacteroidota bacterium]
MSNTVKFKKELGLFDSSMLVAGSMIGSGIFIVTAEMSRQVGSPGVVLLIWLFTGILTIMTALGYGELAGMFPKAGGQYVYLTEAYGRGTGFVFGLITFFVVQTGVIAAVAIAFAKFTGVLLPWVSPDNILVDFGFLKFNTQQLTGILLIVLLSINNLLGLKNAKIVQGIFTVAKIGSLLFLIAAGIYVGLNSEAFLHNLKYFWNSYSVKATETGIFKESLSGLQLMIAIGLAMVGSLFSCDAWNNITYTAGEVKNPQRNIPYSLIIGVGMVVLLYFLANVAYFMLLPVDGNVAGTSIIERGIMWAENDRVGVAAAGIIFGNSAIVLMAIMIMVSTFGCNNGMILAGARLYYAMAQDKLFFKKAGVLNKRHVPGNAIIMQAIWASVLCLSGTYGKLLDYTTFASLSFYVITVAGIIILRKKQPQTPRPYKTLFYPYLPILYIIFAGLISLDLLVYRWETSRIAVFIIGIGIISYFILNRFKKSD